MFHLKMAFVLHVSIDKFVGVAELDAKCVDAQKIVLQVRLPVRSA